MKFIYYFPGRWMPITTAVVTGPVYKQLAIAAEKAGFWGVAMDEHPAPVYPWLKRGHHCIDPFICLAAAAAATEQLKVMTYLSIVAYRNPFMFTKAALSVDFVSNGRLILGVGVGYLKGEFDALGVDFEKRNELFEEALEIFRTTAAGGVISKKGSNYVAEQVEMFPPAVQRPHPPLWLGGNSPLTLRRVAEYGQGWLPMPLKRGGTLHKVPPLENPADLKVFLDKMHEHAAKVGRTAPIDVVLSSKMLDLDASPSGLIDQLKEYQALGVTGATINGEGNTPAEAVAFVEKFGRDVIAAYGK